MRERSPSPRHASTVARGDRPESSSTRARRATQAGRKRAEARRRGRRGELEQRDARQRKVVRVDLTFDAADHFSLLLTARAQLGLLRRAEERLRQPAALKAKWGVSCSSSHATTSRHAVRLALRVELATTRLS